MTLKQSSHVIGRRNFLATASLSAAGLAALAGVASPAHARGQDAAVAEQDAALLNAAIALEHEGIAAYTIAAGSGLLTPQVLKVGIQFKGHHEQHNVDLSAAVRRLGGTPVEARSLAEYGEELGAASLKTQEDVLRLALKLERGAANAYIGLVGPIGTNDLQVLVARLAADEAAHAVAFMAALGEAFPDEALFFG